MPRIAESKESCVFSLFLLLCLILGSPDSKTGKHSSYPEMESMKSGSKFLKAKRWEPTAHRELSSAPT